MTELAQEGQKKKKEKAPAAELADDGAEGQEGRAGATGGGGKKLRLTLVEDEQSNLYAFQTAIKERGLKNLELGDIITEALATVPKEWWDAKVEELTPLEWKLHAALENPEMRAKLMSLLDGKK